MDHLYDDVAIAGMLGELHILRAQRALGELHVTQIGDAQDRAAAMARLASLRATLQMCEEITHDALSLAHAETPEAEQQVLDLLRYRQRAVRLLKESGRCDVSAGDGVFVALSDLIVALEAVIIERDGTGQRARSGT